MANLDNRNEAFSLERFRTVLVPRGFRRNPRGWKRNSDNQRLRCEI
jgi:hypothetical protein